MHGICLVKIGYSCPTNYRGAHELSQPVPDLSAVIVGEIRLFEKLNENMITVVADKLDDSENMVWAVRNMGAGTFSRPPAQKRTRRESSVLRRARDLQYG